jgi:hypothetical protein
MHLVGFYSILLLMMHGAMNVKLALEGSKKEKNVFELYLTAPVKRIVA